MNTQGGREDSKRSGRAFKVFGEYADPFREYLAEKHFTETTISLNLRYVTKLDEMVAAAGRSLDELDEALAEELILKAVPTECRPTYARCIVKRFVRFLAQQGVGRPVPPLSAQEVARAQWRRDYETYLRRQRGASDSSVYNAWRVADRFLAFRFGTEVGDLSHITAGDLSLFLQEVVAGKHAPRQKSFATHLRNFARYLFATGKTRTNLALTVPTVAHRYGARLPRHVTAEQVNQVLQAVQADPTAGRRNYAMVLLLARLGLRAQEVVRIQLEDIDWRAGEFLVRGKGERRDRLPLPPEVGEAVADYLRHERTSTARTLFVTQRHPHTAFKNGVVLNSILKDAFARAGVTPPTPYVGSHILRHSLAVQLVRHGASLEEVGDMLRHHSRSSTLIYARHDLDGLRSIAQPWPTTGGAQ
jgi:site-specific recombinase XerD